ncbi:MAG: hypothetical protein ACLSUM_14690 [Dysosmobacter welbionis]
MRIILKIIAAPFVLALISLWRCSRSLLHAGRSVAGVYRLSCWRPAVFRRAAYRVHAMLVLAFWFPRSRPSGSTLERLYGVKYALQDFMFS